ncbi:MAG: GWxTD domain-containing protein [Ignavibacteriales bacterium]|nr:GWxTD domain-containing protein [Ignavibacteriales bacterium]
MIKNKAFIFFFVICSLVYSQIPPKGIFIEAIQTHDNFDVNCFIPFRVSYEQLVFVKDNSKFTARFNITIEATDSLTKNVFRETVEKTISLDNFELTSRKDLYSQGFLKMKLGDGKYKILPIFSDDNSGAEFKLKEILFEISSKKKEEILKPFVVEQNKEVVINDSTMVLANYNDFIPFSPKNYDLIIPVQDTTINSIDLEISNSDSLVLKTKIEESFISSFSFNESENKIFVSINKTSSLTKNFVTHSINQNLMEGEYNFKVTLNNLKSFSFPLSVSWIEKPTALMNIDFAIKILKYVASEEDIKIINKASSKTLYQSLCNYWKKLDPTPQTTFNELMFEFYERVDYSVLNYSVLGANNGSETDRGKIYIQYGKPDEINRIYTNANNVSEIWAYNSPSRKFLFRDKTGLGNFVLENSL